MQTELKQSFTDWSFTEGMSDAQAAELYRRAAQAGYRAVEMVPPHRWQAARDVGLQLLNICGPGMKDGINRTENHPNLLSQYEALIETAAREGIGQIVVFSGNRIEQSEEAGLANCTAALGRLAPIAERHQVTLMLELLGQQCHPGYQADNVAFAAKVVESVGSSSVKILYDIFHMHSMGVDPLGEIIEHLPFIAHLHVAGASTRGFPETNGPIDYATICAGAAQAGYNGFWGQEFLPSSDPAAELTTAARLFRRHLAVAGGE